MRRLSLQSGNELRYVSETKMMNWYRTKYKEGKGLLNSKSLPIVKPSTDNIDSFCEEIKPAHTYSYNIIKLIPSEFI